MGVSSTALRGSRSRRLITGLLHETLDPLILTGFSSQRAATERAPGPGRSRFRRAAALASLTLLAASLSRDTGPARFTLFPVAFDRLQGWADDRLAAVIPAFLKSCARFLPLPDPTALDASPIVADYGRIGAWRELCQAAAALPLEDDAAARRFFETAFVPLSVADYAEIEDGALSGRGLEFLWVDDPIDAFFLEIQGSGRVRLRNGTTVRVGYDGQNGQPYVAVGRLLVERGVMPRATVTMAAIRDWMKQNPEAGAALRRENPSYVFFRELSRDGPIGTQGAVLTPQRSLAVDRSFIALGIPIWIEADERFASAESVRRLVVAQDTGGAIKGPVRGDP